MKKFLKPSRWKIILFIIIFLISYFLYSLYLSFFGLISCPLTLPGGQESKPQSFIFSEFIQQIPNAITGNYDHCNTPSESLIAAEMIVSIAPLILFALISYILSCGIVSLVTKLKKRNIKKK